MQAVARGIRSTDESHIHTVELNYLTSGSLDDATWAPLIELNAAYTYFPTYAQILTEYNRSDFKPVFLVEANYEFEPQSQHRRRLSLELATAGVLDDAQRRDWTSLRQLVHVAVGKGMGNTIWIRLARSSLVT